MGQIDDEERPFMIIDKDTGRMYDIRNDKHVGRLTENILSKSQVMRNTNTDSELQSSTSTKENRKTINQSAWGDWW